MAATLHELAELVRGKLKGDGAVLIAAARPLSEAGAGHISFIENDKHLREAAACRASALITKPDADCNGTPTIQVADPLAAFVTIFQHLHGRSTMETPSIDPRVFIHPTAHLGSEAGIHPFVSIGERTTIGDRCRIHAGVSIGRHCRLGDDVTIYPNAVLYDGCTVGHRVTIHANAVIGGDGFGYRFQDGRHVKVPQLGSVDIGDDVEIGAATTIDRGAFQPTRIGAGTKIDNLVQIAHNCNIGKHNLIISQVGIAGSSSTGDYVVIAGQAGIVDHVHIGDRVVIGAQAGVTHAIPDGQRVLGSPARPERDVKVMVLTAERLPEMRQDIKQIKKKLGME